MGLIFKLALVALLHLAFITAYPDTGPFGNYYLIISMLLWAGFILFISTAVKLLKFLVGPLALVLNLTIFFLMGLAIALTLPQQDKTRVLEKLQKGAYPTRATLNAGLKRFGINLDKEIEKGEEKLKEQAKKAAKRI
ncbi:MAG: hypothetical protein NTY45_04460 [Elusimicrobia bacterium]|nr:hypothetical protein [Elusimicrobiota bacterium]